MIFIANNLLCIKSDATQFVIAWDYKKKLQVVFAERRSEIRNPLKALIKKNDGGITLFFIKFCLLISAGGNQSAPAES
jgi:hypothetical protein